MSDQTEKKTEPLTNGKRVLAIAIGVALACVIVAPLVLSSQDLVRWATSETGLGLSSAWGWIVIVALDLAAATCVGMVTFAAWRGEGAFSFHLLTWAFALGSAYANYRHGTEMASAGGAQDAVWFFPAMSIAGPLLLEVVLSKVKRWVREDNKTQMSARPRFGARWTPGVAFRETARAWAAARRENIAKPADAIAYVRERDALADMNDPAAIEFARAALRSADRSADPYAVRTWLLARGVTITEWTAVPADSSATISDRAAAGAGRPEPVGLTSGTDRTAGPDTSGTLPEALATGPDGMPALAPVKLDTITWKIGHPAAGQAEDSGTGAVPAETIPSQRGPLTEGMPEGSGTNALPAAVPAAVPAEMPAAPGTDPTAVPAAVPDGSAPDSERAAGPVRPAETGPDAAAAVANRSGVPIPTRDALAVMPVTDVQDLARRVWSAARERGHEISGATLGAAFCRSDRWGRKQVAEARKADQQVVSIVRETR